MLSRIAVLVAGLATLAAACGPTSHAVAAKD
jgi:hypothetical protein